MRRATNLLIALLLLCPAPASAVNGTVEFRAVDAATGKALSVRMHIRNLRGVARRAKNVPFWHDHFVFHDRVTISLPPGRYQFEVERGPEYRLLSGNLTLRGGETDNKLLEMHRFVNMKKEGWWSGDLHVERSARDMPLILLAEDLHVAPVLQWANKRYSGIGRRVPRGSRRKTTGTRLTKRGPLIDVDQNRFFHLQAGKDQSRGGVLLAFHSSPLRFAAANGEFPSSVDVLQTVKQAKGAVVVAEKPYWWDFPAWLANGQVDAICIANDHLHRKSMSNHEAWGVKRSRQRFPAPQGNGRWSQEIYYKVLECGFRIAPAAGSGSGLSENPVGYNRVYVHCGKTLNYQKWWDGLIAGQSIVTNGPMLRPLVNGQLPGHVFRAGPGETLELTPTLRLSIRDPVDFLEIVQNGEVVQKVKLAEYARRRGSLPAVKFRHSGWMLIRAISTNRSTFRFATTAPYYVEIGAKKRISKSAAKFFETWVSRRMKQLQRSRDLRNKNRRQAVMKFHEAALRYWRDLANKASAP